MGMVFLFFLLAFSFAWMWSRNEKAAKGLRKMHWEDETDQEKKEARIRHTKNRMRFANWSSGLVTAIPLIALTPLYIFFPHLMLLASIILALRATRHGNFADREATELGLPQGIGFHSLGTLVKWSAEETF